MQAHWTKAVSSKQGTHNNRSTSSHLPHGLEETPAVICVDVQVVVDRADLRVCETEARIGFRWAVLPYNQEVSEEDWYKHVR